ncbi:MAG: DUF2791 family P-loop domain-containing protein [Anaerolineae bacterium]|nr:DUF2791 family P-loop domain-containing protein [Anaerolineae bacterium]
MLDDNTESVDGASWRTRFAGDQAFDQTRLQDLLEAVVAHTPRLVASRLLADPTAPFLAVPLVGTVMFADVAGFTPLAERFGRAPSLDGVEALTDLMNRVMGILVDGAGRYGGDLLKFGGDAGLFLFDGDDHGLHAALAAQEIQRTMAEHMREVQTPLGRHTIRVAIGLASGQLAGLGLGDAEGRELLLLGPPLAAMGAAQRLAPSGETVLHNSTVAAAAGTLVVVPVEAGFFRLQEVSASADAVPLSLPGPPQKDDARWMLARIDALAPYLAPGLLRLLTLAPAPDLQVLSSDRRLVTVLMTSLPPLPDLTEIWESPEALVSAAVTANTRFIQMRDAVQRYGGVLNKIAMGPGGPYAVVVFGAPTAHEDDPLRAILAAEALQTLVEGTLATGINTGFVFAGDVGTAIRREYTVIGNAVNVAARLMAHGKPGAIWLGPDTASHPAVARRVLMRTGAPISLKGISQPLRPTVVEALRSADLTLADQEPLLVGREAEAQSLAASLQRITAGVGEVVVIHGEPGVGKTRLIQSVVDRAAGAAMGVHMGAASSYGDALPFSGWDRVLASALGIEALPRDQQLDALCGALTRCGVSEWAALVAPIVGLSAPASPGMLSLPAERRELQRHAAVVAILTESCRRQPQLLIFDSGDWLSRPSLALLDAVVDAAAHLPLGLWVIVREETEVLARWPSYDHVRDLSVGPLADAEIGQLTAAVLDEAVLPEAVTAWTVANSAGLPMVAVEAIRALVASGLLRYEAGTWQLTGPLTGFDLPDRIYGLIQSRIDQLSPLDRHLLRSAAAVGQEIALPMLVAAYGEEAESGVRRRLPGLRSFGLVPRDPADEMLLFQQPLVREVAYRGLTRRAQVQIHRRLTRYLDAASDQAVANRLAQLAYHAFEAHLWECAISANLALGRQAMQAYLADQATQAWARALAAADAAAVAVPAARFEAHTCLSEALTSQGRYEEALEHLSTARALTTCPGTAGLSQQQTPDLRVPPVGEGGAGAPLAHPAPQAELDYREAVVLEAQGRYAEALRRVVRGLACPEAAGTVWAARLYLVGAGLQRRLHDYAQAGAWATEALSLAGPPSSGDPDMQQLRSRAMTMLALLASLARLEQGSPPQSVP